MKLATSSATFARELGSGELTQLDWLDLCANELEIDGVVFDTAHFPRIDDDYLAQVKKTACDLGLTVAAVEASDAFGSEAEGPPALAIATAVGAPLVIVRAPLASDDPQAWGAFADTVKSRAGDAKRANVTLALRNAAGTACPAIADLRRLAKDVDSAWLRFAFVASPAVDGDDERVLARAAIAVVPIDDVDTFATPGDRSAGDAIARLARFRGFVVLEGMAAAATPAAYHHAVARFTAERANALETSAFS